jgi:tetratricopeptide (TPR) repeat protein
LSRSNYAAALALLEEALALFTEVGDTGGRAFAVTTLAILLQQQGEYARAQALLEESLVLFKEVGLRGFIAEVFYSLGFISFYQVSRNRFYSALSRSSMLNS